jgi:hypothetical protein
MDVTTRRQRRKEWCRHVIETARQKGDTRSNLEIIRERECLTRSGQIAWAELDAFRDLENADVVVPAGYHYPLAGLHEGEVLHRGLAYIHPALTR